MEEMHSPSMYNFNLATGSRDIIIALFMQKN